MGFLSDLFGSSGSYNPTDMGRRQFKGFRLSDMTPEQKAALDARYKADLLSKAKPTPTDHEFAAIPAYSGKKRLFDKLVKGIKEGKQ